MGRRVIIINPDCSLSAMPTIEEYGYFAYATNGMAIFTVEVADEVVEAAKKNLQNCYVVSKHSVVVELPEGAFVLECDLHRKPPVVSIRPQ